MRFHSRLGLGLWFLAIAGAPTLLRGQSPSLGSADSFAVLGGSSVTSTGSTVVTGNLGVSPGNTISGSITVKVGSTYRNDSVARQAQRDATSAYNDLAARTCTTNLTTDLGGLTLVRGVYCLSSLAQLTGTLILDAANDPNAVWIIKIGGTFTTAPGSSVRVINGGYENNVFWQIGDSINLNAGTTFLGNVLAHKDITLHSGATVSGRLLAQGVVSLDGNKVSLCCGHITLTPTTLPKGIAGEPYTSRSITAIGGAGTYVFSVSSGKLPDGLSPNSPAPGIISGTPTKIGTFDFTLTATDSHGCTGTQAYVIAISCPNITVTNPVNASGVAGVFFSEKFIPVGAIGMATFTSTSTLPAGMSALTADGVLSGTPMQTGTFPIIVMVTDSAGCTATNSTYNLIISCQTITVTAENPVTPNGTVSMPFSQQFMQTGAIGGATFTTTGPLPAGISSISATGLLAGTPMQTGAFPIVVTVTDSNGCVGSVPYPLSIGCQTISVTNPSTDTGTVNVAFSQTFTQTGGIGMTTFSEAGALPAGLVFHDTGVLDNTPMQTGSFPIVVTATDENGCMGSGTTYTLTINAGCSLVLSPPTLPGGTPGVPYSEVITASGGVAPYIFSQSGSLPVGLIFMQATPTTATITGIPTSPGCSTFDVTATDANGCTITVTYTICVAAGGPTLTGWGMGLLSILLVGVGFVMIVKGDLHG